MEALGFGGLYDSPKTALNPLMRLACPPGWGVIPHPRRNIPSLATLNKIGCSNSYYLDLC